MTKEIKKVMNLDNPIPEDSLNGYLFSNENKGHKFIISCTKGGELQTLTGSVTVRFMRANNTTILLGQGGSDGRENYAQIVDGNAEVTLHPDCYNVPGRFKISVFNISGDTVSCIYVGVGTVSRTQNGELIDSGEIVPSIDELVGYIDDCITATENAEAAAEHAVRYDVAQALTDTQKAQARTNIDSSSQSDVDDLKSAFDDSNIVEYRASVIAAEKNATLSPCNVFNKYAAQIGAINNDGSIYNNPSYCVTDFLPVSAGSVVRTSASNRFLAFYDSTKSLIGTVSAGETVKTAPENTAYMRIAPAITYKDTFMAFVDAAVPSTYYAYGDGPNVALNLITSSDVVGESESTIDVLANQIATVLDGTVNVVESVIPAGEIIARAYIENNKTLTPIASDNYSVKKYLVKKGEEIKLKGTNARLNANFPFATFTSKLYGSGIQIVAGSATATNYNTTYTVPDNGYVLIAVFANFPSLDLYRNISVVSSDKIDKLQDKVDDVLGDAIYTPTDNVVVESANYPTYYILANGTIASVGATYTNYIVHEIPVTAGNAYYIKGSAKLSAEFPIAGFKTSAGTSGTCTVIATGTTATKQYNILYVAESNGYIFIAEAPSGGVLSVYAAVTSYEGEKGKTALGNPWYGKKVVWLGTSVSFGQLATKSYPQEAANYLGFNLVNCSIPGMAIEMRNGTIATNGSLTATKAEYASAGWTLPDAPITPYVPGGTFNYYYATWENIFTAENADADLWVFDVVPNNENWAATDWAAFDKNNWKYSDDSAFSEHRETFLGALLYLLDKMYELNPNARAVFVLGSAFAYSNGKAAFGNLQTAYNVGIIDLWGKINTSPKSMIALKSVNGTNLHPSTFAHEIMGKMLVGEFNRFA